MEINPRSKEKKQAQKTENEQRASENQHGNWDLENQRAIGKGKLSQSNNTVQSVLTDSPKQKLEYQGRTQG